MLELDKIGNHKTYMFSNIFSNCKELYTETVKIELPYIDLRDTTELDPKYITAHDIQPLNEDKRIRVFCNQIGQFSMQESGYWC